MEDIVLFILFGILGLFVGIIMMIILNYVKASRATKKAEAILEKATKEADKIKRDYLLDAKEEAHKIKVETEQEIKDKIIEEFHLISGEYALFVNFLTSDSDNSNFMIYGFIYHNENNGIYFIGFVESDGASFKELNILVPSNPYDYKTELIEFKKANGWG